jgi:hypothetical protein
MNERLNAAKGLFVVAAGVRGPEVWVHAARSGGSHKSAIRSSGDQPAQAFNYKLQSERSHRFLPQPEAPNRFQTDPGSNLVAAACKARSRVLPI